MSLIFEYGEIVDRKKETEKIEQIIRNSVRERISHAIVIWADSGYGKSAIMQKVKMAFEDQPLRIAIAETPPSNNATSVEGQYLNYIAEAIDRTLKNQFSLEAFLYSPSSNIQQYIDAESNIKENFSMQKAIISKIGQTTLKTLKAQRLLYDTDTDSILVLKNYIESAMCATHIIVDITNAQNIDNTSFRVINGILQDIRDAIVIFEYTTPGAGESLRYAQCFASQLRCTHTMIGVDKLPFDFALSIIGVPEDQNKIYEIERFYQNVVKGNLYRIMQAKRDSRRGDISFDSDPIESKIRSLGYASKLVLAILCLHDGQIDMQTLNAVLHMISTSFYIPETWINELETLIWQEGDHIQLRHASIADTLQLTPDNAAAITAYRYLSQYYEPLCNSHDTSSKHQAVIELVKLYSRFDPSRMIPLLQEFKQILIERLSEADAITLIKQAFDALGEKKETEYHFRLIALCYEAGFYKGAYDLLNELGELKTECGKTYQCMLLNRNDCHYSAIAQCDALAQTVHNPRYLMISLMIKMLSERSLGDTQACHATFDKINNNPAFHDLLEYGFFLRNAQIVHSPRKSLSYLQRSIDFFEQRNEEKYKAYSELTYVVQSARLGNLNNSAERLEKIAPILLQTSFEKHIVYLNQASIRLLSGRADEQTRHLLDKALITVTTVFDRLVILNNILCSLIIAGVPSDEFESLLWKLASETQKEPDKRICRKVYTNIFLYYQMIGDEQNAIRWRRQALQIQLKNNARSIENLFLVGGEPTDNLRFLSTKPCCVCFITYWHFDIPLLDC